MTTKTNPDVMERAKMREVIYTIARSTVRKDASRTEMNTDIQFFKTFISTNLVK